MANEAVLVFETDRPIPFTCADGAGIEKGCVLKLADPMTVSATSADNDIFGGIAAEEKIASDGKVKIGVYRRGIFKMLVGAAGVTVGKDVVISAANTVVDYTTLDDEKGYKVGKALETAANGETALIEVNPN